MQFKPKSYVSETINKNIQTDTDLYYKNISFYEKDGKKSITNSTDEYYLNKCNYINKN